MDSRIGYKTELVEYKWINVFVIYIGVTIYNSYICSERRTKLCNISKLLIDELRLLDIYFKERSTKCNILTNLLKPFCL